MVLLEDISTPNPLNVLQEVDLDEIEPKITEIHQRKHFILHRYEELPDYLKDNQFILQGYRVHFSFVLCVKSLFKWHNETLNIWTHLVGFVMFFILMVVTLGVLLDNPTGIDIFIFFIFLIVAQLQMLFSTIFHIFCCYSPAWYTKLATLDYSGITVMIVGSYYPVLYYGLACFNGWRMFYLVCISTLGVIGMIVSFVKIFSTPKFRVVRAAFFLVFGFFAVFPMPHMIALNGIDFMWPILWKELLMGAAYTVGAIIYSTRVPERWFPGKFDLTWYSHPIWHLFAIAGALFQLWVCVLSFQLRSEQPCTN